MTIIVPNYVKNDTFCVKFIFELIIWDSKWIIYRKNGGFLEIKIFKWTCNNVSVVVVMKKIYFTITI